MSRLLLYRLNKNVISTLGDYLIRHDRMLCICSNLASKVNRSDLLCYHVYSDVYEISTLISDGYLHRPLCKNVSGLDICQNMLKNKCDYNRLLLITNSIEKMQIDIFFRFVTIDYYLYSNVPPNLNPAQNRLLLLGLFWTHKKRMSKIEKQTSRIFSRYLHKFNLSKILLNESTSTL